VVHRLARIPKEGDHIEHRGFRYEVVDMDRHRLDKVLVSQLKG
jgi:putative hemolysin